MSRILVAYSTNAGSTAEVAEAISQELKQGGHSAETRLIAEVSDLQGYDAVVVGAPMIFGWHSATRRFLNRHRTELAGKKVALFATAMRLTQVESEALPGVPLNLDPNLASAPERPGKLSLKERFTTTGYYLKPMLDAAPEVKPVCIAFFKGKLEMFRLKWWQAAFVMIVVQGTPGDYRDWDWIKAWGRSLNTVL